VTNLSRRVKSTAVFLLLEMTKTRVLFAFFAIPAIAVAVGSGRAVGQPRQPSVIVSSSGTPADFERRTLSVPSPDRRTPMRTTVWKPKGAGPFPLVLINHGSTQNAARRALLNAPQYAALSQWFVSRGYVVAVPQRPGHGKTGGPYLEDQGGCSNADFAKAGLATADSIETALRYMTAQPYVRRDHVVIVGQSAGGWGALALASRSPAGFSAVIRFAPGRGGHSNDQPNRNCAPGKLVETAGVFGRSGRIPTLWIFTENDSYFGPALSRRMVDAYRAAGGIAEYRLLPPYGNDGHRLIELKDGASIWGPLIGDFLAKQK
jgi:dienelactone hydrolase